MVVTDDSAAPVIQVEDLRMRYGTKDVLQGVDFTLNAARSLHC